MDVTNCPESADMPECCAESDVVIMVDESPGQRGHHEATRELVLEESKVTDLRKRESTPDTKDVSLSASGDHPDHTRKCVKSCDIMRNEK